MRAFLLTLSLIILSFGLYAYDKGSRPCSAASAQGTSLTLWNPTESSVGGLQADSRLDKTVWFWRGGLTLKEVFAAVRAQTGVDLKFWPADDLNARVRVNLYLNRDHPPTLRDFMATLMWVTDCVFARKEEENAPKVTYYLLSTSIGEGVEKQITAAARMKRELREWRQMKIEEQNSARLEQILAALRLSRAKAIRQYRGQDDYLLYALLNPDSRSILEFLLTLSQEKQNRLLESGEIKLDWKELSPEWQRVWKNALGIDDRWSAEQLQFFIGGLPASLGVTAFAATPSGPRIASADPDHRQIDIGLSPECELRADQEIALRRLLGEHISQEQEQSYVQMSEQAASVKARAEAEGKREGNQPADTQISQEAAQMLSAIHFRAHRRTVSVLWEIQEAVARAAGVNVISDSFCDLPRRNFERVIPEGASQISALDALNAAGRPLVGRDNLLTEWPLAIQQRRSVGNGAALNAFSSSVASYTISGGPASCRRRLCE